MRIAGAGAAGLSLGLMVPGAEVFEKDDTPGGLCRSTTIDGFTFDIGPHILGGIPDAVQWVVESTGIEFVEGVTRNVGWLDGQYVAHPFEDEAVGQRYMAKMWKMDPAELAPSGLGAQQGRKPGGVKSFLYPAHGGYQAITDAWAAQLGDRLHLGTALEEADVWTGPVQGGRYNTLVTVTAGFEGEAPPYTAVYLPDDNTPFHRLSFPSTFAPGMAPEGYWSVQGETSYKVDGSPGYIWTDIFDWLLCILEDIGLTHRPPVLSHVKRTFHAYPVPVAQPATPNGHGRTGSLRYLNVDGVVAQSMERAAMVNA